MEKNFLKKKIKMALNLIMSRANNMIIIGINNPDSHVH